MDALGSYLTAETLRALGEGNLTKFCAYLAIFALLWFQLRGLRKEFKQLNATITKSFAEGETRFDNLEKTDLQFEHRLTLLETKHQS